MPVALSVNETWRFQLEDDYLEKPARSEAGVVLKPGKPNPAGTWWILRAIPASVHAQITDAVQWKGDANGDYLCPNRGSIMRIYFEHGVVGVDNWKDERGNDVPMPRRTIGGRDVADLAFLDRLSVKHRYELCNAIESRQKVTLEEGN